MLPAEVRRGRQLAFKTGTSYGFRDAWAVGYDPQVTIAVWAGRPDGTPMPGHSGRVTAAPVLFKIADLLGPAPRGRGAAAPGALRVARRPAAAAAPARSRPAPGRAAEAGGAEDPLSAGWGDRMARRRCRSKQPAAAAVALARRWPAAAAGEPRRPSTGSPGRGFARLTVIDAEGRSARATVRLAP